MLLAFLLLFACDQTLARHRGPVPAQVRERREYKAHGGRLGHVFHEHELLVEGYAPLPLDRCEPAALSSRAEPKLVLLRCGEAPWRPVYLGEEALLWGCPLGKGEEPSPLPEALVGLWACHPRPEEVLAQAGEGRIELLRATAEVELPLDAEGADAWTRAVRSLEGDARAEVAAVLRAPSSGIGAWRAVQLGQAMDPRAVEALVETLVGAPRGPVRDRALPALLLGSSAPASRVERACRALPTSDPADPGARDLRAALALAMGEEIGACAALQLPEDACLVSLRCPEGLCSDEQLRARVREARSRPIADQVRQPGLLAEDVVAAFGAVPIRARRRTARLYYEQKPADPPCSAAAPGEPCACLETELLASRALCEATGPVLRLPDCEAEVDDATGTLRGRRR